MSSSLHEVTIERSEQSTLTGQVHGRLIQGHSESSLRDIPRSPPPPDDARVSQLDMQYLQYLLSMPTCRLWKSELFGIQYLLRDVEVPIHYLLPLPISSKPLRYAMLAISSSRTDGSESVQSSDYIARWHQSMRQAISDGSILDIVYSSYVVFRRGLETQEQLDDLLTYLYGVTAGIRSLTNHPPDTVEELLWMERMWRGNYYPLLFERLRPLRFEQERLARYVDQICLGFDDLWPWLPSNLIGETASPNRWILEHRPRTLELFLYYYFFRYLLHVDTYQIDNDLQRRADSKATLRQVLQRILQVGRQQALADLFRKISGMTLASTEIPENRTYTKFQLQQLSVYCFAFLLDSMFVIPQTPQSSHITISAALAQCYISSLMPATAFYMNIQMKFLFISGLIVTTSEYPEGETVRASSSNTVESEWIETRMKQSIDGFTGIYSSSPELLLTELERDSVPIFFSRSNEVSIDQIWTLKVGDVKLWQCLLALTCFFGRGQA
jgi:hypothetical protein